MLAYQPDIRATIIVQSMKGSLNEQQQDEARKLALTFSDQFVELRHRRTAILENATGDDGIADQLMEIKMDTVDLVSSVRTKIRQKIINRDRQKQLGQPQGKSPRD